MSDVVIGMLAGAGIALLGGGLIAWFCILILEARSR